MSSKLYSGRRILRLLAHLLHPLIGSGLGYIKPLDFIFRHFISMLVPKQFIIAHINDCKLGMDIGGSYGLDALARGLLLGNSYEAHTTMLFGELVKPDMVVVDIGAHIGYYTILASKLVGPKGRVFAFEPEPKNYADLKKNIELNRCTNIAALRTAVSSRNGKARLFTTTGSSGECSLIDTRQQPRQRPKDAITTDTTTLDNILGSMVVDAIKIDVDGGEMDVLMGAGKVIKGSPDIKIFTEFWEPGLKSAGYSCAEYWDKLMGYGLEYIYLIDERKKRVWRTDLDGLLEYLRRVPGVNLLCSKRMVVGDTVEVIQ